MHANPDGSKHCPKCDKIKTIKDFHKSQTHKDGLSCHCRECRIRDAGVYNKKHEQRRKLYMRKYNMENREKMRLRGIFKRYGLTELQLLNKVKEQENKCAICGNNFDIWKVNIDHSHKTGKVRDLLCLKCNNALGCIGDSVDIAHRIIKYLKKWGCEECHKKQVLLTGLEEEL